MTYGGWPLYNDLEDVRPGDTAGHDADEHGATWSLVAPEAGDRIGTSAYGGSRAGR